MSNETDLDWLARNVHVWPEGKHDVLVRRPRNVDELIWSSVLSNAGWITKKQWLARRAGLQNKPSWKEAPEWAQFLGQDEDSVWYWHGERPNEKGEDVNGQRYWMSLGISDIACRGELLGDWRDTLEKRTEEFKPFTSIEGNQGREGVNQKLNELEMLGKVSHLISDKRHRITHSKYTKAIHGVSVDVYDVLQAWGVSNPALQHLIKKALQCGQRGHKDNAQDLQDIIDSAIRAKELG